MMEQRKKYSSSAQHGVQRIKSEERNPLTKSKPAGQEGRVTIREQMEGKEMGGVLLTPHSPKLPQAPQRKVGEQRPSLGLLHQLWGEPAACDRSIEMQQLDIRPRDAGPGRSRSIEEVALLIAIFHSSEDTVAMTLGGSHEAIRWTHMCCWATLRNSIHLALPRVET